MTTWPPTWRGDWRAKSGNPWSRRDPRSDIEALFQDHEDLRAQIFASSVDMILQIDNIHLTADDFRIKNETEKNQDGGIEIMQARQEWQEIFQVMNSKNLQPRLLYPAKLSFRIEGQIKSFTDKKKLKEFITAKPVTQLQLVTEIKALKEELLLVKKNHGEEVNDLQNQISNSGLTMDKIMADIRAQCDELTQKNQEELDKYWSYQVEESTTVVAPQTTEIRAAEMTLTELRCMAQSSEISLDLMRNLKAKKKKERKKEKKGLGQHLRRLPVEGEDLNHGGALDNSHSIQFIQKTTTHGTVDSKLVAEVKDTEILRH
ncbi:hypothetical protein QTO34_001625 [Cnephaeus nilssonii]|uniref:IF rod domain-containing protein n=1 Tax=Cnephaeus nilssonii TaxID=3371016 RepID=A0AA40HVZ8_CNENI|nr:hypothetical protein QTO34_001625 [Eptesicus nilssonii]